MSEENSTKSLTVLPSELWYKRKKLRKSDKFFICAMLAPPILYFLIFWVYVNISSIMLAFQDVMGNWSTVTLKVVISDFSLGDNSLLVAICNTLLYFTSGILMLPFQVVLAYFLYRKVKGYRVFRVIIYLPAIISGVVVATAFQEFVRPDGPLGVILQKMGVKKVPFLLGDSRYATWTMVFYQMWMGWGGSMLLLGGALVRIPVEIFESARIDGIGTGRELVQLVFPLLWSTLSTLLILNMTGLLTANGPVMLFTGGNYRTTTLAYWIYAKVVYAGKSAYNEVAATGLIFTLIGVPVILALRKLVERIPVAEY